jgi:predicted DNA-binding transcriptional regulator AlpA
MDTNQARIVELLREVQVMAFKEIERLNLRIVELESQNQRQIEKSFINPTDNDPANVNPNQPEMLNEMQVAKYLNMSVASLRKWRLFRTGPQLVKIGSAVRYKSADIETWLDSLVLGCG